MASENLNMDQQDVGILESFRQAMGRFAGAVNAITTEEEGEPSGLIATAVCSLSFEPPSVLVCVNKKGRSHDAIIRRGAFAVNLLSPSLMHVASQFQKERGAARFSNGKWSAGPTGSPMLVGAPMALDCQLAMVHDGYSHSILVGEVVHVELSGDGDDASLLWKGRGYHQPIEVVDLAHRPAAHELVLDEMLF
ncbi:MAG: flavin reductase [Rhodobacteraceae bacterium]|nr:flavin reductase [Paracoccaceae bacterium]